MFRFALKIRMEDKAKYSGILLGLILILMMVKKNGLGKSIYTDF
ncbi:MAG: hypothetical protein P0S96_04785 [Simkaniaceae bacterium]|nr:hypothetical protein [Candidatus Sacchlamyda saccharinae]